MGRKEEEVLICISTAAVLWCCFLLLPRAAAATSTMASPSPVCAGSAARPVELREPLGFCGHAGLSCCDAVDDEVLRAELEAMNISDDTCAAVAKAFLCAKCIPSLSSVLFNTVDPTTTKLAIARLCASTSSLTSVQQHPVTAATGSSRQDQNTMCLERISSGSYIAMAAHPDGSGRVFLSTRDGKIFLAAMPRPGFGVAMRVDSGRTRPFLDLRDRVLGILGMAFHPDFAINGRFFVSYYCDSSRSTACGAGRCWGDAAAAPGNSSCSCRYRLVVAEFSAKGGPENYSKATRADPSEVRRIFAMGLPQPQKLYSYQRHHGQILLRPGGSDRYLYLISGHGDFSKNGRSFLGKILRFDVDRMLKAGGNGTQQMSEPEIFSMGVNNPSGCSFDSDRPSRLYCADVNEQRYERVYLITNNGGNHGISPSSKATASVVINHGRPVDGRMPSIVGGFKYHGSADPSLKGRFLYIYASGVWTGVQPPESRSNTGHYYTSSPVSGVSCSRSSPLPCHRGGGGSSISGRVLSLGEDNSKDAFFLTTGGVLRVVPPRMCGGGGAPQAPWPPGTGWVISMGVFTWVFALYLIWSYLSGGGQINCNCNNWFSSINVYNGARHHQE